MWVSLSSSYLEFAVLLEFYIHVFIQIWKVFSHSSSDSLSALFYLSSSSGTPIIHMLALLMVYHRPLRVFSFFPPNLLLSSPQPWWFTFPYLQVHWFFLLPDQICLWIPRGNLSVQLLYFSAPGFLFSLFLGFLYIYWYFHFVHTLFSLLSPHIPKVLWAFLGLLF